MAENNTSLIRRASAAMAREIKAAASIIFPGSYGGGYGGGQGGNYRNVFDLSNFFAGFYSGSNTNYQLRLGDPSASSPLATVFNWVGKRLPSAQAGRVIEIDKEENEKPVVGHALTKLMRCPNPYIDATVIWKHYAFSWCLDGNVYWWVLFNRRGQPSEIWPLPFWNVWPRWTSERRYIDVYEFQVNGVSQFIPPIFDTDSDLSLGRIMHFQDGQDTYNYRIGMSPLKSLYRPAFTSGNLDNFAAALSGNMGVPPLLFTFKELIAGFAGKDGQEKLDRLQDEIRRRISGDNVGKPLVITYPMDAKQLSWSPSEMQVRDLDFRNQEQVAAVYGIPIEALGFGAGNENSTYNNKETSIREAVRGYMVPLWEARDQAMENKLLPWFQTGADNLRVKFDESTVYALREDEDKKHDRVRKDVGAGLLKVKDGQMMLGWKADPDMDCYLRPQGLIEIRDGQVVPKPISPAEQASLDLQKQQLTMKPKPGQQNGRQIADGRAPGNARPAARKLLAVASELPMEHLVPATKDRHDFSIAIVQIVGEAERKLSALAQAIPDEDLADKGRETEPHITCLFGLHTDRSEEIKQFVSKFGAISASYGRTNYFSAPDSPYDVVYVEVASEDLTLLNQLLRDNFDHTATRPDYTPHATLAYVKAGLGPKYAGNEAMLDFEDLFQTIQFRSRSGLITTIPLQIEAPDTEG